jgi:DNA ligase-1
LPDQELWLDPWDPQRFAFVSHAHSDHIAPHQEVILSDITARLMHSRIPGERTEHILPFNQLRPVHNLPVVLLPAGHIFGSAQIWIDTADGSLLYTGDFKLRKGRSAEPAEWRHSDTLVMETTYGLPRYCFPSTDQVINQIVAFCHDALDDQSVPVLLGYSLGKAQEILCSLAGAGLTPMLHGSVYQMTRIYEQFGQNFCHYLRYDPKSVTGTVLICPPSVNRSRMLEKIPRKRVAMISGWAMDPNAIYRYQVDAAFPLSDHADYTDLVRYVQLVQPKRVLTLHGFAGEFARDLRARGIEAWALTQENQMEFRLGAAPMVDSGDEILPAPASTAEPPFRRGAETSRSDIESEFAEFARVGEAIAATAAKLEKTRILAEYLRGLNSEQLPIATVYFTGKSFAQSDLRTLQVGWSVTFRALQAATRISQAEFHRIAHSHGDAGKTAFDVIDSRTRPEPFSLRESRELFDNLHRMRGPGGKAELLQRRFEKLSALEGAYIVKILTGDLRIGLREGLVEDAIAKAFNAPLQSVQEANMLLGDVGATALLAARRQLDRAEISLFRPIKSMLASPEPTAEAIWDRFASEHTNDGRLGANHSSGSESSAPDTVYVEDKFDGIRAQLHRNSQRAEIFSRDLKRITDQFPELVDRAQELPADVILDGEIVAFAEGRKLTFFDLQKRLGRKNEGGDLFAAPSADVPVWFVAFDLLWIDGRSVLKLPLWERRQLLRSVKMPAQFRVADVFPAHSAAEIEQIFRDARRRENEGLMIKDPGSFYSPGRRGMYWFKLKKELATLDVVVVAAELGHGKRNHVLSDYTFAVRDETTGELLPIGKAYSGLTDVEIAELTEHFKQNTIANRGRYRQVKPDIVLEVAFNSIQPSTRHASGLALRFPRIKAIRRDKTVDTIDTLSYARELAEQYSGPAPSPRQ